MCRIQLAAALVAGAAATAAASWTAQISPTVERLHGIRAANDTGAWAPGEQGRTAVATRFQP